MIRSSRGGFAIAPWSSSGENGIGDLDEFSARVRDLLAVSADRVPARMRAFVAYLEAHDLPAAYCHTAMIGDVLRGMSRRLTRANPLDEALPVLVALHAPLQTCFEAFFPELKNFADLERVRLLQSWT